MGIAERKERDRLRRRKEIIDAAEIIFFKHGFESATVENIAEQAELSKATLYMYFKSKDELYFTVCLRGQEKLYTMVDKAIEGKTDTMELIKAFMDSIIAFEKKYPDYFQTIFYFQTHPMDVKQCCENEDFIKHKEIDKVNLQRWVKLVERGKKEGVIRPDLDPISTVLLIWMQLTGFLKMYSVAKDELNKDLKVTREKLLADYYELIFSGIKNK